MNPSPTRSSMLSSRSTSAASLSSDGIGQLQDWIRTGSSQLSGSLPPGVNSKAAAQECLELYRQYPISVHRLMQNVEVRAAVEQMKPDPESDFGAEWAAERDTLLKLSEIHLEEDAAHKTEKKRRCTEFCSDFKRYCSNHWKTILKLGARDALASFVGSLFGIAAAVKMPQKAGLVIGAASLAGGGFFFGKKLGNTLVENKSWDRHPALRHVISNGLSLGCAAVAVLMVKQYMDMEATAKDSRDDRQSVMAQSIAFTAVSSLVRSAVQIMAGARCIPQLVLADEKKFRLTWSENTGWHILRLALAATPYALTTMTIANAAGKAVNESVDFFQSKEEMSDAEKNNIYASAQCTTAIFRAVNEALDAIFGALALLAIFGDYVREKPRDGLKKMDREEFARVGHDVASREFFNLTSSTLGRAMATPGVIDVPKALLAGATEVRGSLVSALPSPPLVLADGCETLGDGNCLLHAVAGEVNGRLWVADNADEIRGHLADRISDYPENPVVQKVARYYLGEVAVHMGPGQVYDGQRMNSALPTRAIGRLMLAHAEDAQAAESRKPGDPVPTSRLEQVLDDLQGDEEIVKEIAEYYRGAGTYLPTLVAPLLASIMGIPIAIHSPAGVERYDSQGQSTQDEPDGMVHVRYRMAAHSHGDHFERVVRHSDRLVQQSVPGAASSRVTEMVRIDGDSGFETGEGDGEEKHDMEDGHARVAHSFDGAKKQGLDSDLRRRSSPVPRRSATSDARWQDSPLRPDSALWQLARQGAGFDTESPEKESPDSDTENAVPRRPVPSGFLPGLGPR